jgi:hypothetical protein
MEPSSEQQQHLDAVLGCAASNSSPEDHQCLEDLQQQRGSRCLIVLLVVWDIASTVAIDSAVTGPQW